MVWMLVGKMTYGVMVSSLMCHCEERFKRRSNLNIINFALRTGIANLLSLRSLRCPCFFESEQQVLSLAYPGAGVRKKNISQ